MNTVDERICEAFSRTVKVEHARLSANFGIRYYIPSFFDEGHKNIPLIFLSKSIWERLISSEVIYFEPDVEAIIEEHGDYIWVKHHFTTIHDCVYVIHKEYEDLYSIRGYVGFGRHCFAPIDIDKAEFKRFIHSTSIPFYIQNVRFAYSVYIESKELDD